MSKVKTKKAALRRFKVTASGKIMRRKAYGRHLRRSKSASQKRAYKRTFEVTGKKARVIKRMLDLA